MTDQRGQLPGRAATDQPGRWPASPVFWEAVLPLDYMMPVMDGRATCAALRADARLASIPVVVMSAVALAVAREGCPGCAYLEKPFELEHLLDLLNKLICGPGR